MERSINDIYKENRHLLKNGDRFIAFGTGAIASVIREADGNAQASHVGMIVELGSRLLIVDSNAKGNHPEWLSTRIECYNSNSRFAILRSTKSQKEIDANVKEFIIQSDDERTKYDYKNGIKELCNRWFGWHLKIKLDNKHHICSESVRRATSKLGMMLSKFDELSIAFPQDYIRYRDLNTSKIMFFKD